MAYVTSENPVYRNILETVIVFLMKALCIVEGMSDLTTYYNLNLHKNIPHIR